MNTPRLETERLVLRRFEPSDLQAFFQIFSDGEVNRFLPWFPVRDLEEAQAFYQQRYAPVYAKAQGYAYAICRKEDNVPIGYVNGETEGARDFGYGLRKEFWGQGIVTEASRAVLAQMKEDGVPFVTATHDRENPGSGKVMQKLGMVYHYSYREQWQPKDISVVFRMYQMNLDGDNNRVYRAYWDKFPEHLVETELEKRETRGSPFFVKIPPVWRKRRGWRPRLSSPASGPGG